MLVTVLEILSWTTVIVNCIVMLADCLTKVIIMDMMDRFIKTIIKCIAGPRPGPTAAEAQEELRRK